MKKLPVVSIIIPVRNEEANLPRCLESIKKVDYPSAKRELIIVDGYSDDRTVEIARSFGARVFYNRQKIRATGCQIGINKAKGEIIAFTDADCVVPKNWLRGLLEYLNNDQIASVGGPNITPKDDSDFAKASGEAIWLLTRAGSRYGLTGGKVIETYHNPGCNVIYRKSAVLQVGGFDPHLLTCEDEELDFRLRKAGYKLLFTPKVVVDHYRRPTYRRIYTQAYRFAVGRTQAIRMHWQMSRWFHFVPSLLLISVAVAIGMLFAARDYKLLAISYLLLVFVAFLIPSVWLAVKKKTVSYYIYLAIFICWFAGWGLGFLKPFFQSPESREKRKKK